MKRTSLVLASVLVLSLLLFAATLVSAQTPPNWAPGVTYATGQLVLFNAQEFKCIQGHTSQTGWEPPNVPALWGLVGPAPGGTPTPTPTPGPTPTPQPTPSPTATPKPTPTPTPGPTPTATPTPTPGGG